MQNVKIWGPQICATQLCQIKYVKGRQIRAFYSTSNTSGVFQICAICSKLMSDFNITCMLKMSVVIYIWCPWISFVYVRICTYVTVLQCIINHACWYFYDCSNVLSLLFIVTGCSDVLCSYPTSNSGILYERLCEVIMVHCIINTFLM